MAITQAATAATTATPTVPGYSPGRFASSSGSFSMTAANDGYIKPSVVNIGGKAISVPAKLRMAANAGQYVKDALRLNPWLIAGTLATGWLLDQGMEWVNGQWMKTPSSSATHDATCYTWIDGNTNIQKISCGPHPTQANVTRLTYCLVSQGCGSVATVDLNTLPAGVPAPATDTDWNDLPDPLPVVAPELPYAPYMPSGAPVDVPEYDFLPFSAPLGQPYTKPDGSTSQPMVSVSPNGDKVTIDTFDQPLTDPQGNPVQNPAPQDTHEPQPSECQQHPNTIGCAEFGTAPAPDSLGTLDVPVSPTVTPVGGGGSCPADITTSIYGLTWTYQPICDFASAVRPFIIGFAWLAFAYIVAGTVRT